MNEQIKNECRFCHQDLADMPRDASMTRHIVGLCTPSRNEVDTALAELEAAEKQRTRKALEYVNAQRRPAEVTFGDFLWFCIKVVLSAAVIAACVIGWFVL